MGRRPDRQREEGKGGTQRVLLEKNTPPPQGRSLLSSIILSLEKGLTERYIERGTKLFSSDQPEREG